MNICDYQITSWRYNGDAVYGNGKITYTPFNGCRGYIGPGSNPTFEEILQRERNPKNPETNVIEVSIDFPTEENIKEDPLDPLLVLNRYVYSNRLAVLQSILKRTKNYNNKLNWTMNITNMLAPNVIKLHVMCKCY